MYFMDGKLILINNKSGSFHSEAKQALSMIQQVHKAWNLDQLYFPSFEDQEIDIELEQRKHTKEEVKNMSPLTKSHDSLVQRTLGLSNDSVSNRFFKPEEELLGSIGTLSLVPS